MGGGVGRWPPKKTAAWVTWLARGTPGWKESTGPLLDGSGCRFLSRHSPGLPAKVRQTHGPTGGRSRLCKVTGVWAPWGHSLCTGTEDRQAPQTGGSPPPTHTHIRKETFADRSASEGLKTTKMHRELGGVSRVLPLLQGTPGPEDSPRPNLCEQCGVDSKVRALVGQVSWAWRAGRPVLLWRGCGGARGPCPLRPAPHISRPSACPEPDVWPEAPACPAGNVSCSRVTPQQKGLRAICSVCVSLSKTRLEAVVRAWHLRLAKA